MLGNVFLLPQHYSDPCAMTCEVRGEKGGMKLVVFLGGHSALSKQDECREREADVSMKANFLKFV